jgi:hypothetical protein
MYNEQNDMPPPPPPPPERRKYHFRDSKFQNFLGGVGQRHRTTTPSPRVCLALISNKPSTAYRSGYVSEYSLYLSSRVNEALKSKYIKCFFQKAMGRTDTNSITE